MTTPTKTALLLLADGRLPAGAHAHSGGVEAAVSTGLVHDLTTLGSFLRGRLGTAGMVTAAFAGAAASRPRQAATLDAELDARTPSPALRKASRAQGRALLRAGKAMWSLTSTVDAPHHAVALGLVAGAAGLGPRAAALAGAYGTVPGPATAAVRLLALDPYPVQGLLAELAPECDRVADAAAAFADHDARDLPAHSSPLLDILAETHATWEVRLFAS